MFNKVLVEARQMDLDIKEKVEKVKKMNIDVEEVIRAKPKTISLRTKEIIDMMIPFFEEDTLFAAHNITNK